MSEEEIKLDSDGVCIEKNNSEELGCVSCEWVETNMFGPSHYGSKRCESGSIASGGTKSHCSCGICF